MHICGHSQLFHFPSLSLLTSRKTAEDGLSAWARMEFLVWARLTSTVYPPRPDHVPAHGGGRTVLGKEHAQAPKTWQ